ncbi:MAG: SDR family NAD(P)-dependent oxidoreductase [Oscillospiraceae bacterium]|nr:SDR family NAD(P)-dependent oxidoreductase [Oscillospiraceae bacterium]
MKNVLVTGGAGGLGLEIVRQHLEFGDRVWALDIGMRDGLAALMSENNSVKFIECDISRTCNVQASLKDLASTIGKLDYLYACAGIYRFSERNVRLPEVILDDAASMFDINAVGFLRVCQVLLSTIKDNSVIMCITSEAGSIGENTRYMEYNYCMSKAAENMACVILQKHFDNDGINARVVCIHPGWLRTEMGGPDAFANPEHSVAPKDSAKGIIGIARDIDAIPKERMFMDYKRMDINW